MPCSSAVFDSYQSPLKGVNGCSIPNTPESCCSSTASANSVVSRYGYDLSRDFAVLTKVEELCERLVEPEELQQAVEMLQDQRPTVRQIAEVIMSFSPPCTARTNACTDQDEEACSMAGSMLADLQDPDDLASLQQLFEEAMDGCMGFSEDGEDSLITPRSVGTQSVASSSTLRNTPSIPSLSLGTVRKSIMRMGALSHRAMMTGRDTLRTRRRMTQMLDPGLLRVLLPTAARKAAGRHAARQAAKQQGLTTAHNSKEGVAARTAVKPEVLEPHAAGRPSADDLDQRQAVGTRRSHHVHVKKAPGPHASVEADQGQQQKDVLHARDVASSTGGKGRPQSKPRRASLMHRSIMSHALGAAWWAEYAIDEEDEEVVLPEAMWSIHTALQHSAPDTVSCRITGRSQLAQTAYSLVYTALLDNSTPVVLKVLDVSREDLLANAFAEASVLDSLRSWAGSVKMLACGRSSDNQVQLVLQRCDKNLRHWAEQHELRGTGAWAKEAFGMFHQVVVLVAELHERGIAHCDLKMDNVLLLEGSPLLSDFSEAVTFADAEQAYLYESRGTEAYQSPEMFMGKGADARAADVWALGCLLFELLTGRVLFPGQGDCLRPTMAEEQQGSWMVAQEVDALAASAGPRHLQQLTQVLLGAVLIAAEQRVGITQLMAMSQQLAHAASQPQVAECQADDDDSKPLWPDWEAVVL